MGTADCRLAILLTALPGNVIIIAEICRVRCYAPQGGYFVRGPAAVSVQLTMPRKGMKSVKEAAANNQKSGLSRSASHCKHGHGLQLSACTHRWLTPTMDEVLSFCLCVLMDRISLISCHEQIVGSKVVAPICLVSHCPSAVLRKGRSVPPVPLQLL